MGWSSEEAWNPWRALRTMEHARMQRHDLPDGVLGASCPYPGRPAIVLDRSLGQVERNAVLAHELVHLERGGACRQDAWREERIVDDEVARRLVPFEQLRRFVVQRETLEHPVEVWEVAETWRVPEYVARRAMEMLVEQMRGQIAARHTPEQ